MENMDQDLYKEEKGDLHSGQHGEHSADEDEPIQKEEQNLSQEEAKSKSGFFGKKNSSKDEITKLKEENSKLLEEKRELNDKFLRLYSEFDNYKKRTHKEKLELIDTASEKVILDMLTIVDDFERAIKANESIDDASVIKEGFDLIYQKLLQVLRKNGVEEIPAMGEPFDTDYHEAITHVPVGEDEKGKVIDVTQKGYKIKNKVIRYAKVVVGN